MISTFCVMCVYIQEAEKFPRVLLLKVILICDVTQESMIFISIQKTAQKTLTIKPNQRWTCQSWMALFSRFWPLEVKHLLVKTVSHETARMYLQFPLRQWVAGNVYLLVLFSWEMNIAQKLHCLNGVVDRFVHSRLHKLDQPFHQIFCQPKFLVKFGFFQVLKSAGTSPLYIEIIVLFQCARCHLNQSSWSLLVVSDPLWATLL